MENIQVFNDNQFGEIRMVLIEDKPYAFGVDVAKNLEYARPSKAVSDHCQGVLKQDTIKNAGGYPEKLIPEGDIYRLIVKAADQSQNREIKEKAQEFEKWVFDDVLPSIRRHGMYAKEELLDNPDLLIEVVTKLKEEREKRKELEAENKQKDQKIGELQPKADYTDKILNSQDTLTITQIAKDYGMSGRAMNSLLHDLKVQYKQSGQWLLYSEHQAKGYTDSEVYEYERKDGSTGTALSTKWRQKGRLFLYNLLKEEGVLPTIEKTESKNNLEQLSLVK